MRIKEATIFGYGKWVQTRFVFSRRLQIIYGENEAGKTTLKNFLLDMLFGFASGRSPFAQYLPKTTPQYGGELLLEETEFGTITLRRTGGKVGGEVTVIFADGHEGKEAELARLLTPLTKSIYTAIYVFDGISLSQSHLNPSDLTEYLLTIGAVGNSRWLKKSKQLQQAAQKLYKPTGRNPELNQALKKQQAIQQKVNQAQETVVLYENNQSKLEKIQTDLAQLSVKAAQTKQAVELVRDQKRLWPLLEEQQQIKKELANNKSAQFNQKAWADYQNLAQKLALLAENTNDLLKQQEEQQAQLNFSNALLFYLKNETEIKAIDDGLRAQQDNLQQQNWLNEQFQQRQKQLQELEKRYHWGATLPEILPEKVQLQLKGTLQQVTDYQVEEQQCQLQMKTLQSEIEQLEEQITQFETTNLATSALKRVAPNETQPRNKKTGRLWVNLGVGLFMLGLVFLLPISESTKILLGVALLGAAILLNFKGEKNSDRPLQHSEAEITEKVLWQQALAQEDQKRSEWAEHESRANLLINEILRLEQELNAVGFQFGYQKSEVNEPENWLGQQADLEMALQLQQDNQQTSEKIAQCQWIYQKWVKQVQLLATWVRINEGTPFDVLKKVKQFIKEMQQQQAHAQGGQSAYRYNLEQLQLLKTRRTELENQQKVILQQQHLISFHEFQQARQYQLSEDEKKARLSLLNQQLGDLQIDVPIDEKLPAVVLQKRTEALAEKQTQWQQQKDLLIQKQAALNVQQSQIESDGSYTILRQQLAAQNAEVQSLALKWAGLTLTSVWINEALELASAGRQPDVIIRATEIFKVLTASRYGKIKVGEQTIAVFSQGQQWFDVRELSQATKEQLYLAIRLAFSLEMAQEINFPLLIDDGFVHFDEKRRRNVLNLLTKWSQEIQILYFTAQQRIKVEMETSQILDLEKEETYVRAQDI